MFIKIVIVLLLLIVAASLLGARPAAGGVQRQSTKPAVRLLMLRVAVVLLGLGAVIAVLHLSSG